MNLFLRTAAVLGAGLLSGLFVATASADIEDNTNYATQNSVNSSVSSQTAAAVSGSATAADDAILTSGAATAQTVFEGAQALSLAQYNQTDAGAGVDITGNFNGTVDVPTSQAAANVLQNGQNNAAVSGNASCTDAGECTTGAALSLMGNIQSQIQELLQTSQSAFPPPPAA